MDLSNFYTAHLLDFPFGYHQLSGLRYIFPDLNMKQDGSIDPDNEQDGFENGLPIIRECRDRCHGMVDGKMVYHCVSAESGQQHKRVDASECKNCPARKGREKQ